ncbi:TRAP transporter substrate-binding protein DctP [bacterium]|nr:TRAP transporter substrate-binding protein DctP [bacterium]
MRRRYSAFVKQFALLLAVVFIGTLFNTQSTFAATYRMKIQSGFPRGDLSMELLKVFAESADKRSNGQLQIKVFAEPEIIPGDQLFNATKQGVLDMVQAMGGYWAGVLPIGNAEFNLPLAFRIDEESTFEGKAAAIRKFVMTSGYIEILRKEYAKHGFYFLDIHTYGPVPFVLSTKPVKTCSDLKGMKIKADGINRMFHSGVGMVAVDLPPTEAYMSLKLGTVDAAEWDVSCVTGMKWHEVAPYWIRGMESDHTLGHILVSMKKWNKLPDNLKKVMHEAAEEYWYATVAGYKAEVATVEAMFKTGEVKEAVLDQACQKMYAEAAHKIWQDLSAEDPASAELINLVKKWRGNQ